MKIRFIHRRMAVALIGCASSGLIATSAPAMAQTTRGGESSASRSTRTSTAQTNRAGPDAEKVQVTRASHLIGVDVLASDNRKVGDIVDYYLDVSSPTRLAYVVVMTGGFLNMGGDRRAIPASAITMSRDNARLNVSSERYWGVPVLPDDRQRFISDPQHRQQIAQLFRESGRTADTSATSGSSRSTTSATSSDTSSATASASTSAGASDANRAGAMTGRSSAQASKFVSFNELQNSEAYGQEGQQLGYVADAWISLNDNRAPYIEITPTFLPFRTIPDRRYAIPTAKITQKREYYGYELDVTTEELNDAEWVTEAEGVSMLQEGRFGDAVLRVTVPER